MASKPTVLIVDDDPAIRKMILEMLGLEGYPVDSAMHGQDALGRLSGPRIILLDLLMPVLDGRGFMERLEANPTERARHKVILVSAMTNLELARDIRADGMLPKPFTMDQLVNVIESVGVPA
jgi:CheY-like chemotaxis protein